MIDHGIFSPFPLGYCEKISVEAEVFSSSTATYPVRLKSVFEEGKIVEFTNEIRSWKNIILVVSNEKFKIWSHSFPDWVFIKFVLETAEAMSYPSFAKKWNYMPLVYWETKVGLILTAQFGSTLCMS